MPHKRKPRNQRGADPLKQTGSAMRKVSQDVQPRERERVRPLVEARKGNVITAKFDRGQHRKGNLVPVMDMTEIGEVVRIIDDRYGAAEPTTTAIAQKMEQWEKQYHGQWQDEGHEDAEHIYLGKTREMVQIVHSFFVQLISQLPDLMTFTPMVRGLQGADEEWRRASVAQALINFYLDDVWRVRTDVLPDFLKTFLKNSQGVVKVAYVEDDTGPDLKFEVVNRALLYFDPMAKDLRDADWLIEVEYMTRREVEAMFDDEYWHRPKNWDENSGFSAGGAMGQNDANLRIFYGDRVQSTQGVKEDDLLEVRHYYQPLRKYQEDRYAVTLNGTGGALVRYGAIPWPYKGIPLRGKSYDPHEWRADGTGMVEMYTAIQEIMNTLLNMRLDDVRENMWSPLVTVGKFINQTTIDDIESRQKFLRLSETAQEFMQQNPGSSVKDMFQNLGTQTSTAEIFNDMGFLLGQGADIAHVSDAFKGQASSKVQTAEEVQAVLGRSQGVFRGPLMQVMRMLEEVAEIAMAYFKAPDFFGPERIIQVLGPNRYAKTVGQWHTVAPGAQVRSVSPDEMDVDVTIRATNGVDAMMARSAQGLFVSQMLQAIGQVDGLADDFRSHFNVGKLLTNAFRAGISDVEAYEYTEEEKQQRTQQREQSQMQQMSLAAKMEGLTEQAKAGAQAQATAQIKQLEAQLEVQKQQQMLAPGTEAELHKIVAKEAARHSSDMELEMVRGQIEQTNTKLELMLANQLTIQRMFVEAGLELQVSKQGGKSSIGTGTNRINKPD